MARARRRPSAPRQRDYAAEYARRQAKARSLGYGSYYQRRIRAGAPPSAAPARGERLAKLRGHRSSRDLERAIRPGTLLFAGDFERDADGRLVWIDVRLVDEATGKDRTFRIQGKDMTADTAKRLLSAIDDAGATTPRGGSLDVVRLLGDVGDVPDAELAEIASPEPTEGFFAEGWDV